MIRKVLPFILMLLTVTISAKANCPSKNISVSLLPVVASLNLSETQLFTATTVNASNTAVTWYVNGLLGGNGTIGTVSVGGLYTAPVALPSPANETITASSVQDPSRSASATVFLTTAAPPPIGTGSNLLNNVCAGSGGLIDCTSGSGVSTPSGWSVRCTESFEAGTASGATPGACDTGSGSGGETFGDSTTNSDQAHHGSKSWTTGVYGGPGGGGSFFVSLPTTSRQVYLSWWQYLPSGAGLGLYDAPDFYIANFIPVGGGKQMTVNSLNTPCTLLPGSNFGYSDMKLAWQPQGVGGKPIYFGCRAIPFDAAWHHWEINYLANTSTSGVSNADGVLQIWRDGTSYTNLVGVNLNWLASMLGMSVHIGGHFESLIWDTGTTCGCGAHNADGSCNLSALCATSGKPSCDALWVNNAHGSTTTEGAWPSCGSAVSVGYGCDASHFNATELGGTYPPSSFDNVNNACAGMAPPTTFHKYIDDIVVLYK